MLAELSSRFITLSAAEIDGGITDALRQIAGVIGVDRSQLIRLSPAGDAAQVTHSWAIDSVPTVVPGVIQSKVPWSLRQLRAGQVVVIPAVDRLPPDAAVDRATLQRVGTRSTLAVPMLVAGQVVGALVFACLQRKRNWPQRLVEQTRVLAEVFANALAHKRALEELDAAIDFERKASHIMRTLVAAPRAQRDSLLDAGLREVVQTLGAECATLWRRGGAEAFLVESHRWLADGAPALQGSLLTPRLPWIGAQIERGLVVRFARHADLPAEAAVDLKSLRELRIGAAVVVPLMLSGIIAGALSITTTQDNPAWPNALVPRLQLLGEAFAGFLARQESERREFEAQAQATHAARVGTMGVFAASLVHELTQPLAASLANAQTAAALLEPKAPDLDDLRATVADIVADSRRAGEMIQKLRRFLRHGEAERIELDLAGLLADVLGFVKAEAADKGIAITLDVVQTLPRIVGDRAQIQQVLLNLLLNACDAVAACDPGARQVQMSARPSESGVSIEVTDHGAGMDEATVARIFQPFFTTKPGGMGLGLSISQTIVANHRGTLAVRSAPGQGSTFRIELPSPQPLVVSLPPVALQPAAAGGTVYVIDDDEATRRAIERQLQGEGYRVEAFANAHAFLDRGRLADVACVVSDVRMPGLSGLDLQATLARQSNPLPIVFVSGHADIPMTAHAMKAGAVAFLPKPFAKAELLAAVADALARSHLHARKRRQDADVLARHGSLTPRERDVFGLVVGGLLNKSIADRLGIAEPTVKIHRGRVVKKMNARSVADLVRMAECVASLAAPQPLRYPPPQTGPVSVA